MAIAKRKYTEPSTIAGNYYVYPVVLTQQDIDNKYIVLPETPTNPDDVTLEVKSGPRQFAPEDFIVVGDQLQWDSRALEIDLEVGYKLQVQFVV